MQQMPPPQQQQQPPQAHVVQPPPQQQPPPNMAPPPAPSAAVANKNMSNLSTEAPGTAEASHQHDGMLSFQYLKVEKLIFINFGTNF